MMEEKDFVKKEDYEAASMEIVAVCSADIICTSPGGGFADGEGGPTGGDDLN